METFSMEKMEKPVGNSPFSAIGPPPPPMQIITKIVDYYLVKFLKYLLVHECR